MEHLPLEVLDATFKFLKQTDLIEAPAVCKKWRGVIWTKSFCKKINETNELFLDKEWLIKSYYKHFDRFKEDAYWDCIDSLPNEKIMRLETEVFDRMFYSVMTFRVWSHFRFCSRSQRNINICQCCTKLQITDSKIVNYINKKLIIDVCKLFPSALRSTVVYAPQVPMFFNVRFGLDKQRPHSQKIYGVLHYEEVSSSFVLFKTYLDIIGRIIFNYCDKYLIPNLFEKFIRLKSLSYNNKKHFSVKKKKLKQNLYLSATKFIKRLVVSTCETANSNTFIRF